MKISILHPSYGRPELAFKTAINWVSRCVNPLEYIICLSWSDPWKNDYIKLFKKPFKMVFYDFGNMVRQVNYAAKNSTGDLLIATSDDFDCQQNWDEQLINQLKGKKDFIVKTVDGIQPDIITLPIMDRTYYERFNYIYHPEYNHFYGDEELYEVGKKLGRLINLPIKFDHVHYIAGKAKKDATNVKNSFHYAGDKATFQKRKAAAFPA